MFRSVTAVWIAAMVFWHAIAGCCAHHVHAAANDHAANEVATAPEAPVASSTVCCQGDSARSHKATRATAKCGSGITQVACACQGSSELPSSCSDQQCVLSTPDGPLKLRLEAATTLFASVADHLSHDTFAASAFPWERENSAPAKELGHVRRHLAFSVLLR